MSIVVRRATADDIAWLAGQLSQFAAACGTRVFFSGDTQAFASEMVARHVVFIALKEGAGRVGMLGAYEMAHPFDPGLRFLSEAFWWVDPPHRGSRAGLALLNEYVDYGKANADLVTCSLIGNSQVDEKCLTKRGFVLQERTYLLEP